MKYMLLIYDNAQTRETFLGEQGEDLMAEVDAVMQELTESGELVGGEGLADPSNTKTIRLVDGVPAITDGPYAEAKEHLGGYLLVDCESAQPRSPCGGRAPASHRSRCARSWARPARRCEGRPRPRGPAAPARAAGPRRPGPPLRAVRRVRGRRAGGAAGRRGPVARGGPRSPAPSSSPRRP